MFGRELQSVENFVNVRFWQKASIYVCWIFLVGFLVSAFCKKLELLVENFGFSIYKMLKPKKFDRTCPNAISIYRAIAKRSAGSPKVRRFLPFSLFSVFSFPFSSFFSGSPFSFLVRRFQFFCYFDRSNDKKISGFWPKKTWLFLFLVT